jgi:hypothetical protein
MLRTWIATGLLFVAVHLANAAPPAFVVQTKPIAALVVEAKLAAKLAGGDPSEVDFDDWLEDTLGENGFRGLDLAKPLVAYTSLKGKWSDTKLFFVVPMTREDEFLDLLVQVNHEATAMPDDQSVYRIGADDDEQVLYFRFHKGHAYFVLHGNPKDLDPKTLPNMSDLLNSAESSLLMATLRPGEIDAVFRKSALEALDVLVAEFAAFPIAPELSKLFGELAQSLVPLAKAAIPDTEKITVRLYREVDSKELFVEATLLPKLGSSLAKDIAARKPQPSRFGRLTEWPDAAAVLLLQQPNWNAEARTALADQLQLLVKQSGAELPEELSTPVNAFLSGLVPPAKAGTLEVGVVLTAPDKTGFGGIGMAVTHSDSAALSKAFIKMAKIPPKSFGDLQEDFLKAVTLNAAKAGDLPIHTVALQAFLPEKVQAFFGEKTLLAVAFDKEVLYVAFGPGAVAIVQRLPSLKMGTSNPFETHLNAKLLADWPKAGVEDWQEIVTRSLGTSAKLESVEKLSVTSDNGELKIRQSMTLQYYRLTNELPKYYKE